jgi:hypothetical protein
MSCTYCGKEINNPGSLVSHQLRCKLNPEAIVFSPRKIRRRGQQPWNKGLTKETSPKLARSAEKSSKTLTGRKGHKHTPETKQRLQEVALQRGLGGYQERSGRGKKGRYRGVWCDSSWELAFVIYCLENGKEVQRSNEKRNYEHNNEMKTYLPDFVVDGELVEIKGYITEQWESKQRDNPDVKVLSKPEMQPILIWVEEKYGKDFTRLYDEKHFVEKIKPPKKVKQNKVKKEKGKIGGHNALSVQQISERLNLISPVDFSKFGWVERVAKILNVSHTQARRFVSKHYQGEVYTRKSPLN